MLLAVKKFVLRSTPCRSKSVKFRNHNLTVIGPNLFLILRLIIHLPTSQQRMPMNIITNLYLQPVLPFDTIKANTPFSQMMNEHHPMF